MIAVPKKPFKPTEPIRTRGGEAPYVFFLFNVLYKKKKERERENLVFCESFSHTA